MKIYNSQSKQLEEFISLKEKQLRIYVCGPTVYSDSHIGHARSSIFFDFVYRYFKENEYNVILMKNYTDIDDKIIKKHLETKEPLDIITKRYIQSYEEDMKKLNVLESINPLATDNISSMEKMILNLLNKGFAYKTEDGIYLKNTDFSFFNIHNNGDFSRLENSTKLNSSDFVLWKFDEKYNYPSPLGKGRPGWHIECSAMIKEHLAYKDEEYQIDIHGGGKDLIFPHHENEAKQTYLDSGQKLSKYWLHHGFVNINNEKISKSLNNFITLKELLKSFHGEVVRFYLLFHHYRNDINFSIPDLNVFKKRLDNLYSIKLKLSNVEEIENINFKNKLLDILSNDFNVSEALVYIEEQLKTSNKGIQVFILNYISNLFGILLDNENYFKYGISEEDKERIENLLEERLIAKQNRNFALSDQIRNNLEKENIFVMDLPFNKFYYEKRII